MEARKGGDGGSSPWTKTSPSLVTTICCHWRRNQLHLGLINSLKFYSGSTAIKTPEAIFKR